MEMETPMMPQEKELTVSVFNKGPDSIELKEEMKFHLSQYQEHAAQLIKLNNSQISH